MPPATPRKAAAGIVVTTLWVLLGSLQRSVPKQGIAASLLTVVAAVVAADLIREDSGFVAATTTMGIVLANQRQLDVSKGLEFQGTVVGLLIGILFVLTSASVTPSSVGPLLPAGLGLIAVMMLVIRLLESSGTWGSVLERRERMFMAWLAPRGIVAAATASAFGPALASAGVSGANKILPVAFIAIFGTVAIYRLTATALARRLGVAGTGAIVVLVVGGQPVGRSRSPLRSRTRVSACGCGRGSRPNRPRRARRGWTPGMPGWASIGRSARPSWRTLPTRCF